MPGLFQRALRACALGLMMAVTGTSVAFACANPMRSDIFIYPGFKAFPAPETPPDIAWERPDGSKARLSDLAGKASLVTFWFPRCPGCQYEGPSLNAMLDRYKPQGGMNFLAVSVQGEREEVVRYLAQKGYGSMDANTDPGATLFSELCFRATPVHLVLNADAQMVAVLVGPQEWEGPKATNLIETLIATGGI